MNPPRTVVVTGATGLIGKALCRRLIERGDQVIVFSRSPERARTSLPGAFRYVAWKAEEQGAWAAEIERADAVVSLAGASIAQRWTPAARHEILESRVLGTRGLVGAIERAVKRPQVLVSASAIGFYGNSPDRTFTEQDTPGSGFPAEVVRAWEAEAVRAEQFGVRTVRVRIGVVLDRHEGALPQMLLPFRFFAGGPILPGTQWISWVHVADVVGIMLLALDQPELQGPINATAPEPLMNRDFMQAIGKTLGRPAWMPVPGAALEVAFGEMGRVLLIEGQRVLPQRAQQLGYAFAYPQITAALRAALGG